jgi:hypothetical protein
LALGLLAALVLFLTGTAAFKVYDYVDTLARIRRLERNIERLERGEPTA